MLKIEFPTEKDFVYMEQYALKEFGIPDGNMVAPTLKNDLIIQNLEKNNFVCYKQNDLPIAWSLVLPTKNKIKQKFLSGNINEKELFEESINNRSFESLYLFAVIVLPEYRRRGFAKELMGYQINYFREKYNINSFFAWTLTNEGKKLIESLKLKNSINIDCIS